MNGFIWTFYGALSDVEYWVTVTDTEQDRNRTYHNPAGQHLRHRGHGVVPRAGAGGADGG